MELSPLHRCEESVVKETAKLLNSEWPRSETARIHFLSADCKDDLPCSLVLLENAAGHDMRVIGHSRLSQVLGKPMAVIIESVIVVKDKRGCGLGRKIMDMTESYAAQLSYTTSHLSTHDKCKFYEHLGYVYSTPVSPAKANARLLKHKQISALQTHFGENVTIQQPVNHVNTVGREDVTIQEPVTNYVITGGRENVMHGGSQQPVTNHVNTYGREDVMHGSQQPVTIHVNTVRREDVTSGGSQQTNTNDVNTYGSGKNGVESAEKTEPVKQCYRSPSICILKNSSQKYCESPLAAASDCSEALSILSRNKRHQETMPPTCAPPPPPLPPQMNHAAQETIFWMMKELQ